MLAARARGMGSCWTTVHLAAEAEVAAILGTDFKPGARKPADRSCTGTAGRRARQNRRDEAR